MKTKLFILALAAHSLASCETDEVIIPSVGPGQKGDEYMLEITQENGDEATKSTSATVQLNLADLIGTAKEIIHAQLEKRPFSRGNWVPVPEGVTYKWTTPESDQGFHFLSLVFQYNSVNAAYS